MARQASAKASASVAGKVSKKSTRKQLHKLPKKKNANKTAAPNDSIVLQPQKLPSVWRLIVQTLALCRLLGWKLAGITAVYLLLTLLFVGGLASPFDVSSLRDELGGSVGGSIITYVQLTTTSTAADSAAGVYQLFFFLILSLALIWSFRHALAGKPFRIRDAFYEGMYPLIPFILVLFIIALQLLPLIAATTLYQIIVSSGIAATITEALFWGLLVLAVAIVSLYFLVRTIMAAYIVALPSMRPLKAYKHAKKLVHGQRWVIARKLIPLPIVLFLFVGVIVVPVILIAPALAQFVLLVLGALCIVLAHAYLYNMYRQLMEVQTQNEQAGQTSS